MAEMTWRLGLGGKTLGPHEQQGPSGGQMFWGIFQMPKFPGHVWEILSILFWKCPVSSGGTDSAISRSRELVTLNHRMTISIHSKTSRMGRK